MKNLLSHISEKKKKDTLIVVLGPTASGKTALSIDIAKEFNGEIISADSRIVYQDMKIGTAAPTEEEMDGVIHHMVNVIGPETLYTVKDFTRDAYAKIQDIISRNKTPILVGGTNMYIDAVVEGYTVPEYEVSKEVQEQLEDMNTYEKYRLLQILDPTTAEKIDPENVRHFERKLEYCMSTGKKYSESTKKDVPNFFTPLLVGLEWSREVLYERINQRVDIMIKEGIIEETQNLMKKYKVDHPAMTSIGYRQVVQYLEGEISKEEMVQILKQDTRNYAKRQLTWLRKKKDVYWIQRP